MGRSVSPVANASTLLSNCLATKFYLPMPTVDQRRQKRLNASIPFPPFSFVFVIAVAPQWLALFWISGETI